MTLAPHEGFILVTAMRGLVLFVLVLAGAPASSEEAGGVARGARVRVTAPQLGVEPAVGNLLEVGPESLSLELAGRDGPETIARSAVSRLEVSRGRKSHAGRGALVGLAVGAAATMLLTFGDYSSDTHGDLNLLAIGATLAAGGAAVGGAIGWAHKTEQWEVVELEPFSVAIGPVRGRGVAFSVCLAWGKAGAR